MWSIVSFTESLVKDRIFGAVFKDRNGYINKVWLTTVFNILITNYELAMTSCGLRLGRSTVSVMEYLFKGRWGFR